MKKEKPLLIDTGRGFTIKYRGKFLYSSYNPVESVEKQVKRLSFPEKTLVYIPSLSLGYGIKELMGRLNQHTHVLCVEADKILMDFVLDRTLVPLPDDTRFSLLQTDNPIEVVEKMKLLGMHQFRRIIMVSLSAGYTLHKGIYDRIRQIIDEEIRLFWQNKMTMIHMLPLWIKNIFKNLEKIGHGNDFARIKSDKPVLLTGAGPSLEYNLALIKKIRKKITLVTVDTALPILLHESIVPDYIFILEAQWANIYDFIPCGEISHIPVICDLTSHDGTIRPFRNVYFFSTQFSPLKLFDRLKNFGMIPSVFPPLGSVGVTALHAALLMTTGPVLVSGLDFGYTDSKNHSRGSSFHLLMMGNTSRCMPPGQWDYMAIRNKPLLKAIDKNGKAMLTDLILEGYSRQVNKIATRDPRIYDLSPGGLDLGAKRIKTPAECDTLISGFSTDRKKHNEKAMKKHDFVNAREFMIEEIKLLELLINRMDNCIKKEKTEYSPSEAALIQSMDYVFSHFPDSEKALTPDTGFQTRAMISAFHYKEILKKLTIQ
ncbi:MAG: motility associated factor glycosyltransferase family protein [Spirochaetales bacterium]|nr:motility associated factor glycosyltransferase family protein [Spirochaetales bacterium]